MHRPICSKSPFPFWLGPALFWASIGPAQANEAASLRQLELECKAWEHESKKKETRAEETACHKLHALKHHGELAEPVPEQAVPHEQKPNPPEDQTSQAAVQAAATDIPDWHPFRRVLNFMGRKNSEGFTILRTLADSSLPGSDLANFPNSSFTLPQGGFYLESSPLGYYNASERTAVSKSQWNWEYLMRYGITDNIEFRIFSNGLTNQGKNTGFSAIAFDTKAHVYAHDWDWFNISVGVEAYIQTTSWLSSPAFTQPLQYSFNVLVDHDLPWDLALEWNLGFVRQQVNGRVYYLPSFQWALQRNLTDDIAVFVHGYANQDALPRKPTPSREFIYKPDQHAIGIGAQWAFNRRVQFYGNYNWGLTSYTPSYNVNLGFLISF